MTTVEDQAALDRAAADMAVRDDLARAVAREWIACGRDFADDVPRADELAAALDKLADAHGLAT